MKITLYHNPRCSKSRAALALLQEAGCDVEVVEYLKTPLSAAELQALLKCLGLGAHDLMRTGESLYKELSLTSDTDPAALIEAMAAHPILMERPVAVAGRRAVIGRPPERVQTLLQEG